MFHFLAFLVATVGTVGVWLMFLTGGRINGGGGLMGSLAALGLLCWLMSLQANHWLILIIAWATYHIGAYFIPYAEAYMVAKWGPQKRHNGALVCSDLNATCIDEFHGMFVSSFYIFSQHGKLSHQWLIGELIAAFFLFRFFDTVKPLGIKRIETWKPENKAIMLDDTVAGLYVCIIIIGFNIFRPFFI
ncbi:MAG: phosphatidylglycerophosphatase A [Candidatus Komeilibacteria bacterium]|nr:phosphatidylglycerophosphatase A [Candidatus Komeilibacteria bacterium]